MVERGQRGVAALSYSATAFRGHPNVRNGKEASSSSYLYARLPVGVVSFSSNFCDLIGVTVSANVSVGNQ